MWGLGCLGAQEVKQEIKCGIVVVNHLPTPLNGV